jgi:microcystin-dependent protein
MPYIGATSVHDHSGAAQGGATILGSFTGDCRYFCGPSASIPSGWNELDGSTASRTGNTAALFALLGTTYGAGDGSTTFTLPDTRGRVPVGQGTGTGLTARALGASGGEETHVLITAELASHNHSQILSDPTTNSTARTASLRDATAGAGSSFALSNTGVVSQTFNAPVAANTGSNGSGTAHNNMQPFLCYGRWIIKQ